MSKLRLDMEKLEVETFATEPVDGSRGTVRGHDGLLDAVASDCTRGHSCFCDTAYAVCGTGPVTVYSCQPTSPIIC